MGRSNYTMGLYIQECPKMRYKGAFKGTRLLCSYTHQFVPIEFAKDALEKKESRLYPDEEEAERIHEENAKKSMDHLAQLCYILYGEDEDLKLDWNTLSAFPDFHDQMKAICEFIPKDSNPVFLFAE